MEIGHWPLQRLSIVTNWKGHPRHVFIGRWLAYTHGWGNEPDFEDDVDYRTLRLFRREWEWVRPMSEWSTKWRDFFREKYPYPHEL